MMLSQRRKEVLIKLVAQAIPTYIIGCFLLPLRLREHRSRNGGRKVHWAQWSKLCEKNVEGDMGFRNFKAFNPTILAKEGWKLL